MYSMSIDPSIRNCGWAIWKGTKLKDFGVFHSTTRDKDWQVTGQNIAALVKVKGTEYEVEKVWCEYPGFFGANVTAKSGALVKLAWFVGFLDGLFTPDFIPFVLVRVVDWKGNLPKIVVQGRIERLLKRNIITRMKTMPPDVFDAVGLGLWVHRRMS